MKNNKIITFLALTFFLLLSNLSFSETYREGTDYELLEKPGKVEVPGKIEVREFFWFGCPHCYSLEQHIGPWSKKLPDDVNFIATPTPMSKNWVNHAHAFYVAEALGKLDSIKPALFKAIHVDKKDLDSQQALADFFTQFGVTEEDFNKMFNSFSVKVKVRQAGALSKAYKLRAVPAVVVNGKYLVKGEGPRALDVINFLIEKERVSKQLSASNQQM